MHVSYDSCYVYYKVLCRTDVHRKEYKLSLIVFAALNASIYCSLFIVVLALVICPFEPCFLPYFYIWFFLSFIFIHDLDEANHVLSQKASMNLVIILVIERNGFKLLLLWAFASARTPSVASTSVIVWNIISIHCISVTVAINSKPSHALVYQCSLAD